MSRWIMPPRAYCDHTADVRRRFKLMAVYGVIDLFADAVAGILAIVGMWRLDDREDDQPATRMMWTRRRNRRQALDTGVSRHMPRVAVVDDHPIAEHGIRRVLEPSRTSRSWRS